VSSQCCSSRRACPVQRAGLPVRSACGGAGPQRRRLPLRAHPAHERRLGRPAAIPSTPGSATGARDSRCCATISTCPTSSWCSPTGCSVATSRCTRSSSGSRWCCWRWLPLHVLHRSRRLGASPMTAACIALCTPLLGADPTQSHFLGFQPVSFLWSGGGLFTQLAAMVVFPLALGATSRAVLEGRSYAPPSPGSAPRGCRTCCSGYTACLLGVAFVLRPEARGRRLLVHCAWRRSMRAWPSLPPTCCCPAARRAVARTVRLGAGGVLALLRSATRARRAADGRAAGAARGFQCSRSSRGWARCLRPVRWLEHPRSAEGGLPASHSRCSCSPAALLWAPDLGRLLELLPFSASCRSNRFICAVQFGGCCWRASRCRAWRIAWRAGRRCSSGPRPPDCGVLVVSPAIASAAGLASRNAAWRAEAAAADAAARPALERAFADFRALVRVVPGRGYAGASWDGAARSSRAAATPTTGWSRQDLPAISYMYHTMGLSSDLEPAFDPRRRDHYELFNVRYLLADAEQRLPAFAERRLAEPDSSRASSRPKAISASWAARRTFRTRKARPTRCAPSTAPSSPATGMRNGSRAHRWRDGDAATAGERASGPADTLDTAPPARWQAPRGRGSRAEATATAIARASARRSGLRAVPHELPPELAGRDRRPNPRTP